MAIPLPARRAALGAALLALATSAGAHYLWLERDGAQARLYFGEVNEVREQSPGRLDEIRRPRVWQFAAPAAPAVDAPATRGHGAFLLPAGTGAHLVALDTGYAVKDWTVQGIGLVKPMFYARTGPWPAREPAPRWTALKLDVLPVPGRADRVTVVFDGKPLPRARVVVHAPNGWDQEQQADAEGQVGIATPWRGQYVLEVIHQEGAPGEFEGQRYEAVRHRATLTFVQPDGVDPAGTGSLAPRHPER